MSTPLLDIEAIELTLECARNGLHGDTDRLLDVDAPALIEEVRRLRKDSEMLDWIGSQHTCVVTILSQTRCTDHYLHGSDMTIREAIAALSSPKKEGGE